MNSAVKIILTIAIFGGLIFGIDIFKNYESYKDDISGHIFDVLFYVGLIAIIGFFLSLGVKEKIGKYKFFTRDRKEYGRRNEKNDKLAEQNNQLLRELIKLQKENLELKKKEEARKEMEIRKEGYKK